MAKHMQNASVVVVNNKQNKRRNPLVWVMVLAFAAVLGVGGTFAYLTYTTNQVNNELSTATGLTADVIETSWTDEMKTKAKNMVPGDSLDKNPVVVNTSKNGAKEFVAVKLSFEKLKDGSTTEYEAMTADEVNAVLAAYSIYTDDTDASTAGLHVSNDWTQIDPATNVNYAGAGVYYYTYKGSIEAMTASAADANIDSKNKTTELFKHVVMLSSATDNQVNAVPSNWCITVKAAAIQDAGDNKSAADFITDTTTNWKALLDADAATDNKTGWRAESGN